MKRLLICFVFLLLFSGCRTLPDELHVDVHSNSAPDNSPIIVSPTPTLNPHSTMYLQGVTVDDVIRYFNEVSLDAEFVNSGNPNRIQKWNSPIYYQVHGQYTEADISVIESFASYLNTIEGFPGMYAAADSLDVNLDIHFTDQNGLVHLMGDQYYGLDGAVTFWYDYDIIYDEIICIRSDIDQHLRNSVILEELYNGLGPVQDTDLREDSIIYSGFSDPQELTAMDELIIKLLYHPSIQCGMDAEACESVIRTLYY